MVLRLGVWYDVYETVADIRYSDVITKILFWERGDLNCSFVRGSDENLKRFLLAKQYQNLFNILAQPIIISCILKASHFQSTVSCIH